MTNTHRYQLTSNWDIPAYVQDALTIETPDQVVRIQGEKGHFSLDEAVDFVTLVWGGAGGPALARLETGTGVMNWEGKVQVGGYVTSLHVTELPGADFALAIITLEGHPLKPGMTAYRPATKRRDLPYLAPEFADGVAEDIDEGVTTWLTPAEGALVTLAQDAMLNDRRVYCFGRLVAEDEAWHTLIALPLVLEAVTLFGN